MKHDHPCRGDDLAALAETLAVLSSPALLRQLAESQVAVKAGDVFDRSELAALMAERKQRPR